MFSNSYLWDMSQWFLIFLFFSLFPLWGSAQFSPPFSTRGNEIIDTEGKTMIIRGVNWWGANGSQHLGRESHHGGTDTHGMPYGLHVQRLEVIAQAIKDFGFNTVRLPFSNEMLHSKVPAQQEWVGPNENLVGKTPLEVLDAVVKALTDVGLFVLLNNHSTTTHWCCGYDVNGLWYGQNEYWSQTPEEWIADWVMLAQRFGDNPLVIGADLRNEVRPRRGRGLPFPQNPNWGRGGKNDWHKAATRAGNAIHVAQPDWLIVVEGINGRTKWLTKLDVPHLLPVIKRPVVLEVPQKVVYEVHNYDFSFVSGNFLKRKNMVKYSALTVEERQQLYAENWGFVMADSFPHQAPVILGEFGCSGTSKGGENYLKALTQTLDNYQMGFCWWTLEEDLDNPGCYGIMNERMDSVSVDQDWRWEYLEKLFVPGHE